MTGTTVRYGSTNVEAHRNMGIHIHVRFSSTNVEADRKLIPCLGTAPQTWRQTEDWHVRQTWHGLHARVTAKNKYIVHTFQVPHKLSGYSFVCFLLSIQDVACLE